MLDLMLCVRTSVLNGTKMGEGMAPDALPASAFSDVRSYELNRGGTDHKVFLVDYASAVFHFVREACGVSSSAFLLAWSANDIKAAQVEGSELVYSCDKRYVAMPLLDRDLEILTEMLPKYYEHIRSNPYTLLLKIFGLVSLAKGKKMCLHLLVENVFHHHIPLHYMFHLAASASMDPQKSGVLSRVSNTLRRRSASQSKLTLQRSRSAFGTLVQGRQRSSSLLLDPPAFAKDKLGQVRSTVFGNEVSWKAEGRTILVEKNVKPLLMQQLDKDLAFLRDCGITDHKIVVGIHEGEPIAPPSPDFETKRLVKVGGWSQKTYLFLLSHLSLFSGAIFGGVSEHRLASGCQDAFQEVDGHLSEFFSGTRNSHNASGRVGIRSLEFASRKACVRAECGRGASIGVAFQRRQGRIAFAKRAARRVVLPWNY